MLSVKSFYILFLLFAVLCAQSIPRYNSTKLYNDIIVLPATANCNLGSSQHVITPQPWINNMDTFIMVQLPTSCNNATQGVGISIANSIISITKSITTAPTFLSFLLDRSSTFTQSSFQMECAHSVSITNGPLLDPYNNQILMSLSFATRPSITTCNVAPPDSQMETSGVYSVTEELLRINPQTNTLLWKMVFQSKPNADFPVRPQFNSIIKSVYTSSLGYTLLCGSVKNRLYLNNQLIWSNDDAFRNSVVVLVLNSTTGSLITHYAVEDTASLRCTNIYLDESTMLVHAYVFKANTGSAPDIGHNRYELSLVGVYPTATENSEFSSSPISVGMVNPPVGSGNPTWSILKLIPLKNEQSNDDLIILGNARVTSNAGTALRLPWNIVTPVLKTNQPLVFLARIRANFLWVHFFTVSQSLPVDFSMNSEKQTIGLASVNGQFQVYNLMGDVISEPVNMTATVTGTVSKFFIDSSMVNVLMGVASDTRLTYVTSVNAMISQSWIYSQPFMTTIQLGPFPTTNKQFSAQYVEDVTQTMIDTSLEQISFPNVTHVSMITSLVNATIQNEKISIQLILFVSPNTTTLTLTQSITEYIAELDDPFFIQYNYRIQSPGLNNLIRTFPFLDQGNGQYQTPSIPILMNYPVNDQFCVGKSITLNIQIQTCVNYTLPFYNTTVQVNSLINTRQLIFFVLETYTPAKLFYVSCTNTPLVTGWTTSNVITFVPIFGVQIVCELGAKYQGVYPFTDIDSALIIQTFYFEPITLNQTLWQVQSEHSILLHLQYPPFYDNSSYTINVMVCYGNVTLGSCSLFHPDKVLEEQVVVENSPYVMISDLPANQNFSTVELFSTSGATLTTFTSICTPPLPVVISQIQYIQNQTNSTVVQVQLQQQQQQEKENELPIVLYQFANQTSPLSIFTVTLEESAKEYIFPTYQINSCGITSVTVTPVTLYSNPFPPQLQQLQVDANYVFVSVSLPYSINAITQIQFMASLVNTSRTIVRPNGNFFIVSLTPRTAYTMEIMAQVTMKDQSIRSSDKLLISFVTSQETAPKKGPYSISVLDSSIVNQVSLQWSPLAEEDTGGSAIRNYVLEVLEVLQTETQDNSIMMTETMTLISTNSTLTSITLTLASGNYLVMVMAENSIGISPPGANISFTITAAPWDSSSSTFALTVSLAVVIPVAIVLCCLCIVGLTLILLFSIVTLVKYKTRPTTMYTFEMQDTNNNTKLMDSISKHFLIPFAQLDFSHSVLLGSGAQGSVCTAQYKNVTVACKIFPKSIMGVESELSDFKNEAQFLASHSHHMNIIRFIGIAEDTITNQVALLTECCTGGDLISYLEKHTDTTTWNTKLQFLFGIASGMSYLHAHHIIHRDLKCENVLLDASLTPKIIDFGFSKQINQMNKTMNMTMNVGTAVYLAPEAIKIQFHTFPQLGSGTSLLSNLQQEVIQPATAAAAALAHTPPSPATPLTPEEENVSPQRGASPSVMSVANSRHGSVMEGTSQKKIQYDMKLDVYSFAIIMYCVYTGNRNPYGKATDLQLLNQLSKKPDFRPVLPEFEESKQWYRDLMVACWDTNPDVRPSFEDITKLLSNKIEQ